MIGPDVYESPRATYVSGGGGGLGLLVGKHATANKPNVSTTASRRPVNQASPDGRTRYLYHAVASLRRAGRESSRQFAELRSELIDDHLHARADPVQHRPDAGAVGERCVPERYAHDEAGFHVHLRVRGVEGESGELGAQFEATLGKGGFYEAVGVVVVAAAKSVGGGVECPVLVEVRQALEDHERVVVGTISPVVRLQSFQRCHLVRSDAPQLLQVVPELPRRLVDRKVSVASEVRRQRAGVEDRELVREMVERSEERRVGKECRSRWSPYH